MTCWARIGDVVQRATSIVPVESARTYRNVGILNRGRGLFHKPAMKGSETRYSSLNRIRSQQLIFSKLFAWEGAVAVVGRAHDGAFVSSEFPTYDVDYRFVDMRYLSHVVTWDGFIDQLREATTGLGQRRQRVNPAQFEAARLPLPDLTEQRRIAAHLDEMAALPTRAEGRSGAELLWEALLGAPPAGCRTSLADLVQEARRPVAADPDGLYPMFGVRWYGEGLFERERKRGSELSAKTVFRVEKGDLVYNRLFAWKQSFAIARSTGGFVSNEFPTFRIDESAVRPELLHYLLLTRSFTADVNAASSGSTPTSRNRLKVEKFLQLTVDVPTPSAQDQLVETLRLMQAARRAQERRGALMSAVLPAARNEIFTALR